MDLTGIFAWLNDLSAWIAGFWSWLGVFINSLILTVNVVVKDAVFRLSLWLLKMVVTNMPNITLNQASFFHQLTDIGPDFVNFFIATGALSALQVIFPVVFFKFILRVIPLPWRV